MADRRREGRSRRSPRARHSFRTRLLIVCGGVCTERQYFEALRAAERNPAVTVRIKAKASSPAQIVKYADRLRQQDPGEFDTVWCVVDVDEFPDVAAAVTLAHRLGIGLTVSNPCFELWLLLHLRKQSGHLTTAAALRALRTVLPSYDKTKLNFEDFRKGVDAAVSRARDLDPSASAHTKNPTTNVWQVVEAMRPGP